MNRHAVTTDPGDRIVQRLRRARTQTETSVLAIGKLLGEIVEVATEDVDAVKQSLGIAKSESGGQSSDIAQSIRVQSRLIHSFVEEMRKFLKRQIEFSEAANQAFGLITDCSSSVSGIMQNSKILAVNLKIESARLGDNGAAVSTIGMEMMNFSNDVRVANTKILNALDDLKNSLPQIRSEMSQMDVRTTQFSTQLDANLREVEGQTEKLDRSLKDSLIRTEQKNKAILDCSLSTLSELQFQDPVGKELQKAEAEVLVLQETLSQHGLNSCVPLGPGEDVNACDGQSRVSGEVVLF